MVSLALKNYLRSQQDKPEFRELVELLKGSPMPLYRPMRSSSDSKTLAVEVQERNWIYLSGREKERDRFLKLLTLGETDNE